MKYIEAIKEYQPYREMSIFLAGGITNCPNWQKEMVNLLKNTNIVIFNPRREDFPIEDPKAAFEQIKWEHKYLRMSGIISFWFPKETLCPIVLFELGRWSHYLLQKVIFIGIDPAYKRRQDVEIQIKLEKPEIEIVYSLYDLADQIKEFNPYNEI